jgi:hypothetical protein
MTVDLHFAKHGGFWLMEPRTDAAKAWVANRIPAELPRCGNGVEVAPEFLEYIVMAATGAGLICETPGSYSGNGDDETEDPMK